MTSRVSRASGASVEDFEWNGSQQVSNAYYSAPVYGLSCGAYYVWDAGVRAPQLTKRTVTQDGRSYVSESSNFDSYGQPGTVVETGELSRTTTWTYFVATTVNLVRGRPLTQRVCVSTDCFTNSWTYGGTGYQRDSETISGVTTSYGYDVTDGNLTSITNARNQRLTLGGYVLGNGIPTTLDFNGAFTITRTAFWEGWLKTERNGRGYTTTYAYDNIGRITTLTPPGSSYASTYTYAADGSWTKETRNLYTKTTNRDGFGRTTGTVDGEGVSMSTRYDGMGRAVFTSYPYDAATGERGDKLDLDGLGRVVLRTKAYKPAGGTSPDTTTESYDYSGNCVTTAVERTSSDNATTKRCSSSFGDPNERRLASVTEGNGKIWRYSYTAFGHLSAVTAPSSMGNRTFTYYDTQFLESESSADTGTVTYGRNAIGQMTSRSDDRNVTVSYRYDDPLSRLTSITYPSHPADDVSKSYDNANNLTQFSSTSGGNFVFTFDELDRSTQQTWTFGGRSYVTSRHFNPAGCVDGVTYPTGSTLTLTCDTDNRTQSVSRSGVSIVNGISYHPSGQLLGMTYGNLSATTVTFDNRNRTKRIYTPSVVDLNYDYDGADNVVSYDNAAVPQSQRTMQYDEVDRLIVSTAPNLWGTTAYDYDALGNRTLKSVGSYTTQYTYSGNRLVSASGADAGTFQYDNAGNLIAAYGRTFNWDDARRLENSSDLTTYAYSGDDRRISKSKLGRTTLYHYDLDGKLLAETTASGAKIREYFHVANRLIATDGRIPPRLPPPEDQEPVPHLAPGGLDNWTFDGSAPSCYSWINDLIRDQKLFGCFNVEFMTGLSPQGGAYWYYTPGVQMYGPLSTSRIPATDGYFLLDEFTVAAWIRPEYGTGDGTFRAIFLVELYPSSQPVFAVGLKDDWDPHLAIRYMAADGTVAEYVGVNSVPAMIWKRVVARRGRTASGAYRIDLFLDGVLIERFSNLTPPAAFDPAGTQSLRYSVGESLGYQVPFLGGIDDVLLLSGYADDATVPGL